MPKKQKVQIALSMSNSSASVKVFSVSSSGFLSVMPAYRKKGILSQLQKPRERSLHLQPGLQPTKFAQP